MLSALFGKPRTLPTPEEALPGRPAPIPTAEEHFVFRRPLKSPVPEGMEEAMFGMGCFWGVERRFWQVPGVWLTMVGYSAGLTPNPTYKETCTGLTGHNEVVRVIYVPKIVRYEDLLKVFWENHDPTQGNRTTASPWHRRHVSGRPVRLRFPDARSGCPAGGEVLRLRR